MSDPAEWRSKYPRSHFCELSHIPLPVIMTGVPSLRALSTSSESKGYLGIGGRLLRSMAPASAGQVAFSIALVLTTLAYSGTHD
jgi:hypothetical protein